MCLSMFVFSAVDTQAKYLTQIFDPFQVVWMRQVGLFVGVVFLLLWRGTSILKTQKVGLQLSRGACAAYRPRSLSSGCLMFRWPMR